MKIKLEAFPGKGPDFNFPHFLASMYLKSEQSHGLTSSLDSFDKGRFQSPLETEQLGKKQGTGVCVNTPRINNISIQFHFLPILFI